MHRKELEPRFCMADWEFVQRLPTTRLFRNKVTGRSCEEYLSALYSDREKLYFERRAASTVPHLIKVLHFECFSSFNSSNVFTHYNARVFVEHVRCRIGELNDLPENSCIAMLEETLLGFKFIFDEYQPVRVSPAMICLSEERRIRVWLSANFLENSVKVPPALTQQTMVSDIFNIFWRFLPSLEERPNNMDFLQALDYVRMRKSRLAQPRKIVRGNVPTSIDFAPVIPAETNEKMYKTAERFNVGVQNSPTKVTSSQIRRNNVTQGSKPAQQYDSPNKSHIVSVRNPSNSIESSVNELLAREDSLEKYQIQSSCDRQSFVPGFEDSDEDCDGRRQSIVVRIESARTTSKNISVNQRFIELDRNELQLEFLDPKKSKDTKLAMLESMRMNRPEDQNVQRLCRIYNHALRFDPLMYLELQKHQGRLSSISNMYVIKKIVELMEQEPPRENASDRSMKYRDIAAARLKTHDEQDVEQDEQKREMRVRQILEIERAKRTKTIYNKSINYTSNQQLNKTSPHPSKTSIEPPATVTTPLKPEKRRAPSYIAELESLIGPSHESERLKTRSGSNHNNLEQKKKEKNRFMKGFKQEVEKLLFD